MSEQKVRFKMYKSGRNWVFAAITVITFGTGLAISNSSASADTTGDTATTTATATTTSSGSSGSEDAADSSDAATTTYGTATTAASSTSSTSSDTTATDADTTAATTSAESSTAATSTATKQAKTAATVAADTTSESSDVSATSTTDDTADTTADADSTTIYNDPSESTSTPSTQNDVTHDTTVTATDSSTGDTVSTGDSQTNNSGVSAIVNVDTATDLNENTSVTNTSDTDKVIEDIQLLPRYNVTSTGTTATVVADASRISATGLELTYSNEADTSTSLQLLYSIKGGEYLTLTELEAAYPDFTWDQLIAVEITGTLAAGQTVALSTPLTLTNADDLNVYDGTATMTYGDINYDVENGYSAQQTSATARFAKLATTDPGGQYIGTILNSDGTYTMVSSDIQSLMPDVADGDITFDNFDDGASVAAGQTVLYSGSNYYINTSSTQAAVDTDGYTIKFDSSTGEPYAYYSYTMNNSGLTIYDTDGNVAGSASGVEMANGSQYVELVQVIDAKDASLTVGDTWDPETDSFVSLVDPSTGDTLTYADVTETDDVDTSKAGTYTAMYSYTVNGITISKTVNVVVSAADTGTGTDTDTDTGTGSDTDTGTSTDTDTETGSGTTTGSDTDSTGTTSSGASTDATSTTGSDESSDTGTTTSAASTDSTGTTNTESAVSNTASGAAVETAENAENGSGSTGTTSSGQSGVTDLASDATTTPTSATTTDGTGSNATTSTSADKLPQTNEQSSSMSIWAGIITLLAAFAGLFGFRRRKADK